MEHTCVLIIQRYDATKQDCDLNTVTLNKRKVDMLLLNFVMNYELKVQKKTILVLKINSKN